MKLNIQLSITHVCQKITAAGGCGQHWQLQKGKSTV